MLPASSEELRQLSPQLSDVCADPFSRFAFHLNSYHLVAKACEVSTPRTLTSTRALFLPSFMSLFFAEALEGSTQPHVCARRMLQILQSLGSDLLQHRRFQILVLEMSRTAEDAPVC